MIRCLISFVADIVCNADAADKKTSESTNTRSRVAPFLRLSCQPGERLLIIQHHEPSKPVGGKAERSSSDKGRIFYCSR